MGIMETRHIAFDRLHNFRDLGGYRTAEGRVVHWGRLYRSDSLAKLSTAEHPADWERFLALGVRTVIDLRYPWEIENWGRVPEFGGLAFHNLSIEHQPYDQAQLGPETAVVPFLAERYAEVAEDGVAELRRALEIIASDGSGPLVFHCAAGKDRTGLLAALVLSLLGVGEDDIVADYALTGLATERLIADWRSGNPGQPLPWQSYGQAPAEAMRLTLAGLTARYGSVPGYAAARLGADDALTGALRERLLAS
jgi:protein-tyrosine phosphatase